MNRNLFVRTFFLAGALSAITLSLLAGDAKPTPLDKSRDANDQATEAAAKAQKDADAADKNAADKAADKADKQAADDEQAARDAQDKADQSQKAKNDGGVDTAKQASEDANAAQKAWEKAADSEKAADKADKKADKGEAKDNPQKVNRNKQREKRKAAQEYYKELRKSRGFTMALAGLPQPLNSLVATGQVQVAVTGTGETIGKVAVMTVTNLTAASISVAIPALVLESASGKAQDYACPKGQTVAVAPNAAQAVPLIGNCLVRSKPPVSEGGKGQLVARDARGSALNPGDFSDGKPPAAHLAPEHLGKLIAVAQSYDDAAEKLEKKGAFKDMPYSDPETRKNIVKQWGPWMDPELAKVTGSKPATKEDLRKTVYKQATEHATLTPRTREKLDDGIEELFKGIQLASKEAKNLEEPSDLPAGTGAINVSDDAPKPSPTPATQEKPADAKPKPDDKPKPADDKPGTGDAGKTAPAPGTQEKKPPAKPRTPIEEARERSAEAKKKYGDAFDKFADKTRSKEDKELIKELNDHLPQTRDRDKRNDISKELNKMDKKTRDEFEQTPEGRDLKRKMDAAREDLNRLVEAERKREDKVKEEMKKYGIEPKAPDAKPSDEKPKAPDEKPAPPDPNPKKEPGGQ